MLYAHLLTSMGSMDDDNQSISSGCATPTTMRSTQSKMARNIRRTRRRVGYQLVVVEV
jgi:hypothetical protein